MKNSDDTILEILQGHKTARWPAPRLAKVFIASTRNDFQVERRQLLETVGPELQTLYDEHQIEVELVDMHFGSTDYDAYDAHLFDDHLSEIQNCHKISRGCFLLCLIGNKYQPFVLPLRIQKEHFESILKKCNELGLKNELLLEWYLPEQEYYKIKKHREMKGEEWMGISKELTELIHNCVLKMEQMNENMHYLIESAAEKQFSYAMGLAPGTAHRILVVTRDWENIENGQADFEDIENDSATKPNEKCKQQLSKFRERVLTSVASENRENFSVPWRTGGIDEDDEEHESYLAKFRKTISTKLQNLLNKSLEEEPELKSKKKIVNENFQENITHLTLCHEEPVIDFSNTEILDKIKSVVQGSYQAATKHGPLLIYGDPGSGKTSLLQTIYRQIETWFTNTRVLRLVKFASATPRSSYNLELLRIICQQICIALRLPDGFLPKDASFDPLYVNNWFQSLIRMFENLNQTLVLLIDDLHLINPLDSDVVAALNWIPLSLPDNVYLIFTTGIKVDQLRLTPVQREKLRNQDCLMELSPSPNREESIIKSLEELEEEFGKEAISKLGSFISCSEYGLTETEFLELLMPTSNIEAVISLDTANFNFSSLCSVRRKMGPLLREKLMSGKLVIEWSHESIKDVARKRYLSTQEQARTIHTDVANLFFSEFAESENSESEAADEPAPLPTDVKETPFQSTLHSDVTYTMRHIEEGWIHLLKAGDSVKLRTLTVCNFDFLLAAVQTVSVSYLRCLLEHARCYLLDRELELVYYTIRKSSDVLTRDPLQLGTQIISWLKPVTEHSGGLMTALLISAMAWCDGFTLPLVVPLNGWLQPPLPAQSQTLSAPGVRLVESIPHGQHVVCVVDNEPQLWHIMSNQIVHTFKGHTGRVRCMAVTKHSQYLVTGSEDTSMIMWDLKTFSIHLRVYEHIAPVLCVTSALNGTVIVSGGDDSSIIITSLATGKVVNKIDHHRGSVTSVKVTSAGDVLVSGSHDRTICMWCLESYTLLNTISLVAAISIIDVSADSVFLLAACSDNNLYLRTLATGTELHSLVGHKSKVRSICMAQDSCRAVIGCADNRVYIYEMHSGKIMKTLTGQPGEVTSVKVTDRDDFLLTAGGNRVHFYPFRSEDTVKVKSLMKLNKKSAHHLQAHSQFITCIDISRDGQLSATGGADHLINIWQLNTHELVLSMEAHSGPITCVSFAPNGLFVASGSEDKTVKVWGLTLGAVVSTFTGHQAAVDSVSVMMDSSRIISSDRNSHINVWLADNGNLIHSYQGPSKCLAVTNNMKYTVCTNGDNSLKIWSLLRNEERYTVNHSEEITCFVLTMDSMQVITGSRDMSLKVWQLDGGKLSQVMVGHTDAVTCVAVSVLDKSVVVSGSYDTNLIVWDINTGSDLHTLSAHLGYVTCVKVSADGTIAISGSDDKSVIIWDTKRGLQLTSLQVHVPILNLEPTSDCSRIAVHLKENQFLPIICLHNTPAKYVKLPTYYIPAKDMDNTRPGPKRQMRRLLKKEVSLDTYTWQKKYAHLTSNIMIAAMDERLKRRFSVSASMEEISKIPQNKTLGSQTAIAEGASLAQSQHFDQLEALWNKRSPPRRRLNQPLSKQSSLVESRLSSSDEEAVED